MSISIHFPDVHCPQCGYLVQPARDAMNMTIECVCQDCGCHFSETKYPDRIVTIIIRSGEKVAAPADEDEDSFVDDTAGIIGAISLAEAAIDIASDFSGGDSSSSGSDWSGGGGDFGGGGAGGDY